MSILIKGMEMPRACSQCFLYHEAEEGVGTLSDHCGVGWRKIPRKVEKPDWCPLVEVPTPHGDLIDRKGLLEQKAQLWDMNTVGLDGVGTGNILLMPAVIEAEE